MAITLTKNKKGDFLQIQLSNKAEEFVRSQLASGAYTDAAAFVSGVLLRAEEFDQLKLERLRREIQLGLDELERGEGIPFDDEIFKNMNARYRLSDAMFPRVAAVRPLEDYKLEVTFSDGVKGVLDWRERLEKAKPGGVFEPLQRPEYFAQVEAWEGTIRRPNGADICPEVLYEEIIQAHERNKKNRNHTQLQLENEPLTRRMLHDQ